LKRTLFFLVFLLAPALLPPPASAQATATPTSTPNCCQAAAGWTQPTLGDAAGVAVDMARQRVYIVNRGTGVLNAYDYTGAPVNAFGASGSVSSAGASYFYVAMGTGPNDGVYVVQRSNPFGAVTKYDANGNQVWNSGNVILGGGASRYIYVDSSGLVYVVDDTGNIYILDNVGALHNVLTGYAFNTPTGVFKTGSTLYVADSLNNRIVSLPQTGTYTYGSLSVVVPSVTTPVGITADLNGNYYVASNNFQGFFVYDNNWSLISSCTQGSYMSPYGIALDETGAIYVSLQLPGKTVVKQQSCIPQPTLTPSPPNNPPAPGLDFIYPSPARGDHANLAYVMAEAGMMRLKVWNQNGEVSSEINDHKPAGVQATPFSLSGFAPGVYFYRVTLEYDSGKTEQLKPGKFAVIR
jgi:hypothetical protein